MLFQCNAKPPHTTDVEKNISDKTVRINLEGYQVQFDFKGHQKEREIVYRYYESSIKKNYIPKKEEIGIELYDIDNDGNLEILSYLESSGWCGSLGCDFSIFKKVPDKKDNYVYQPIYWGDPQENKSPGIIVHKNIIISRNTTLGMYDFLFEGGDGDVSIWQWKGGYYDFLVNLSEQQVLKLKGK
ncbi:hypothetical protein [Candidatus Phycorickettsia trachydisci]|uniref:hypothetical protein n=1 Tax=Candidatus Phycorickettsia trachydisci TaxID=2115978 RepID=UPI00131A4BF7|nr:hypothetical protein [Candidatus Phycorickettsia trachydisci]